MTARLAWTLAVSMASMPVLAEPSVPSEAPSEELLEYLGSWDGDEEWLLAGDLLQPPRGVDRSAGNRQEQDRVQPRDPAEQEK